MAGPRPSATLSPQEVLRRYRVFAVVGASRHPDKDAHTVPLYLKSHGYRVIPVNPQADVVFGERAYPTLLDMPPELAREVEVVQVFRPSEELPSIAGLVAEFKRRYGRPYVFWAQLGLESEEAKEILAENGIDYVMNACARIVHRRYLAEGGTGGSPGT